MGPGTTPSYVAVTAAINSVPPDEIQSQRYTESMAKLITAVCLLCAGLPWSAAAQDASTVRKMFEAGQYAQVTDAADGPQVSSDVTYLGAQSAQKRGDTEAATALYQRLANLPEGDAWHFVGVSGLRLLEGNTDAARDAAGEAVQRNGTLADAHFQLGLVLARRQEWASAAAAFDRASDMAPSMAYAHYYGGLMHYRANRPDKMANHFEYFLKLAPNAPERPEVMQIMRTIKR